MNLPTLISSAVCLCLDKRLEQGMRLIQQYNDIGIKVVPFIAGNGKILPRYNYIDKNKYSSKLYEGTGVAKQVRAFNCWMCHNAIFQDFIAKHKDGDSLLLIEDDAYLTPDFTSVWDKVELPEWDALYLGVHTNPGNWEYTSNPHLLKLTGQTGGLHSVIFKYNIVKEALQYKPVKPYDNLISTQLHPKYNCYSVYPSIVMQSGYSNINPGEFLNKDRYWINKNDELY